MEKMNGCPVFLFFSLSFFFLIAVLSTIFSSRTFNCVQCYFRSFI